MFFLIEDASFPTWIKMANYIHKDKYDYSSANLSQTKVIIKCHKHGDFKTTSINHILKEKGCPMCNRCPSCELYDTGGKLCEYCIPQKDNKLYKKTKEWEVVNFLRKNLPEHNFIHNKSVGSDCTNSHLFPDIRFETDKYHVIVEVDEHKHRGSGYKCDEQRMYDIITKLGMPCIFIRYNPNHNESNKDVLLSKIVETLDEGEYDDYGFKAHYLYY